MSETLKHYGVLGMKWGVRRSRSYLRSEINRLSKRSKSKTGSFREEQSKHLRNFYLRPLKTKSAHYKVVNNTVDSLRAKSIRNKVSKNNKSMSKEKRRKLLADAKMLEKRSKSENTGLLKEYQKHVANTTLRPLKTIKGASKLINDRVYKLEAKKLKDKAKTTKNKDKAKRLSAKSKQLEKLSRNSRDDNALKEYGRYLVNRMRRPGNTGRATYKTLNDEVDRIRVQKLRKKAKKLRPI